MDQQSAAPGVTCQRDPCWHAIVDTARERGEISPQTLPMR